MGLSWPERREKYKAFMEPCNKCGVLGHYKQFCKGGGQRGKSQEGKKLTGQVKEVKGDQENAKEI